MLRIQGARDSPTEAYFAVRRRERLSRTTQETDILFAVPQWA